MDLEEGWVDGYLYAVERTRSHPAPSPSRRSPELTPDISMRFIFIRAAARTASKELHLLCTLGCPMSFNVREKMPRSTHRVSGCHESSSVGRLKMSYVVSQQIRHLSFVFVKFRAFLCRGEYLLCSPVCCFHGRDISDLAETSLDTSKAEADHVKTKSIQTKKMLPLA